jgi:hypothetical protein
MPIAAFRQRRHILVSGEAKLAKRVGIVHNSKSTRDIVETIVQAPPARSVTMDLSHGRMGGFHTVFMAPTPSEDVAEDGTPADISLVNQPLRAPQSVE